MDNTCQILTILYAVKHEPNSLRLEMYLGSTSSNHFTAQPAFISSVATGLEIGSQEISH